jgi:S1-C subfamily serine protease
MRYLFWGVISFLMVAPAPTSIGVCETGYHAENHKVVKTSTRLESKSRAATIKIMAATSTGTAIGTAAAFKYKGHTIAITAAHVVGTPPYLVAALTDIQYEMAEVVYFDSDTDIAVLLLPELVGVKPMPLRAAREGSIRIGQETVYSGFPNDHDLFTIRGYVSAFGRSGAFYLHSYAWPGASGSCVFDEYGRLMGVLTAIGVGRGLDGAPTAIEDVVYVTPIWNLNFELLDLNLKHLD